MFFRSDKFFGNVIKDDEKYVLLDNTELSRLAVSKTILHRDQQTRGHSHAGQEEVYYFVSGTGFMQVGDTSKEVSAGSIVLVPDGLFHKVINAGNEDLVFIAIFEGKRNH